MDHINKLQGAILELAEAVEDGSWIGVVRRVHDLLRCENCGEVAGLDADPESKFHGKCANCGCDTVQPPSEA